jgi:hypothetical protein
MIIYAWDQVQRFHHPKGRTRDLAAETEVTLKINVTYGNKRKIVTVRADYLISYDKRRAPTKESGIDRYGAQPRSR